MNQLEKSVTGLLNQLEKSVFETAMKRVPLFSLTKLSPSSSLFRFFSLLHGEEPCLYLHVGLTKVSHAWLLLANQGECPITFEICLFFVLISWWFFWHANCHFSQKHGKINFDVNSIGKKDMLFRECWYIKSLDFTLWYIAW